MSFQAELSMGQRAYGTIQDKLLRGDIRAGDLVSELALAEEIGMSRTPVREAIGRLEMEGLLEKVPRVGTLVKLPGKLELRELYAVREALESHEASAAALIMPAAARDLMEASQRDLVELIAEVRRRQLDALDESLLKRYFEADLAFHTPIIQVNGNSRILRIVSQFRVVQRIFEYGRMAYPLTLVEQVGLEHGAILKAVQDRDPELARTAMAAHIRSSCGFAMQRFDKLDAEEAIRLSRPAPTTSSVSRARTRQRPRRRTPKIQSGF